MIVGIRDEDNSFCSVLPGVNGFVDECGVSRKIRSIEWTRRIQLLRLMPEDHRDLCLRIDALVVVVVQLRSRDSIPGKDHGALEFSRVRKRNGHKVGVDFEVFPVEPKLVFGTEIGSGRQLEILEVRAIVAGGRQAEGPELRGDVIGRLIQLR